MFELIEKYHLTYIEDPFHEDDFDSFAELIKNQRIVSFVETIYLQPILKG